MAPFHRSQCHRIVCIHHHSGGLAGIGQHAAWHIYGNDDALGLVHQSNQKGLFPLYLAGKTGAYEGIHQDIGVMDIGSPFFGSGNRNHRDAHFIYHMPVLLRGFAHMGLVSHKEHQHPGSPACCVAGCYEPVASIISCAAENHRKGAVPVHIFLCQTDHR